MNTKPKLSGDNPKGLVSQKNSQNQGQSSSHNAQKNSNKKRQNNQISNYNGVANAKSSGSKAFEYVRKVDTLEGQQQQIIKQQQEEEERCRLDRIKHQQKLQQEEEEERERQRQIQIKLEQERLEQQEQLKSYIQEMIISQICADAENQAAQKKYLKSFEGLSYLLQSNFADFEDVVSTNIPAEVIAFNARQYVSVTQENTFRKRHQTSYNQSNKGDDYSSSNNQYNNNNNVVNSQAQRMTVRQRLNNFNNNNNNNNNNNMNQLNQQNNRNNNNIDQNMRHPNTRNKNLTTYQEQRVNEDDDAKWRQSRAPLFSQSNDELKFLLNVLTPDNFNNLREQFFGQCQNDVDKCIHSLINKVCKEAKYTKLYAQLAIYVKDREEEEIEKLKKISSPTSSPTNSTQSSSFKTKMFQVLQEFFYDQKKLNSILTGGSSSQSKNEEQEGQDEENQQIQNEDGSASTPQEAREKKRFQLFLKFLGELFLSKFMPKKIISYCIQTMMQLYVSGGLKAEDRNLEGIIALIESIGQEFENSWRNSPYRQLSTDVTFMTQIRNQFHINAQSDARLKLDSEFFEQQFISFDGVMKILVFLNSTNKISIRIRSLITNLIYRWNNKWEKALHQKEDPRTLQEIRSQHYEELNKRQQEVYEHFSHYQKSPTKLQKQSNSTSIQNSNPIAVIDYSKEVKRIFTDLDNQSSNLDECTLLLNKLGVNNILTNLLSQFFDSRLENLQQRYQLMNTILGETSLKKSIFLTALNNVMNSLYSQACDFPHLNDSFVTILCPLIMTGYLKLNQIQYTPCNDPDEDEDKAYFFQEFKKDCTSFLRSVNYFICED